MLLTKAYTLHVRTEKKGKNYMEKLIKEAKAGNPDAFTRLMKSQMQNMYKTAGAILINDEDIADAVSETILACWENMKNLKEERFFKTWMTRILVNKCNDIIRKKQYYLDYDMPEEPYNDTGFENAEWKEALSTISEKYRLVMVLYYIEGFSTGDISGILDIPEGTVRSRLARGREQLAGAYGIREIKKGGQAL
jgi:RNA polymerase sigma factor (sigma-70 family)